MAMNLTAFGEARRLEREDDLIGLVTARTQAEAEAWFKRLPMVAPQPAEPELIEAERKTA